jgi:hypothetical protein
MGQMRHCCVGMGEGDSAAACNVIGGKYVVIIASKKANSPMDHGCVASSDIFRLPLESNINAMGSPFSLLLLSPESPNLHVCFETRRTSVAWSPQSRYTIFGNTADAAGGVSFHMSKAQPPIIIDSNASDTSSPLDRSREIGVKTRSKALFNARKNIILSPQHSTPSRPQNSSVCHIRSNAGN